jgi:hypothetical protein
MWKHLVPTVLVLTITAGFASAQERAPESAWAGVAEGLGQGTLVKLRTKDGERMTGTLVLLTPSGIVLQPSTRIPVAAREVPYADIESLQRTRKPVMSPGAKVLLGAGIGAAVVMVTTGLMLAAAGY